MKNKLLLCSLALAGVQAMSELSAQGCQAGFTFSVNNNVVSFTNTSTGASMPVYSWNFGDGNYDWQANPVHTYLYNGTYYVCLTLYDSLNQFCQSTFCDSVVITNAPPAPCMVSVSGNTQIQSGNSTTLCASLSPSCGNISYSWNTGATTACIAAAPTVSTTYTVVACCQSTGCCDTASATVTVFPPCNIVAGFTFNSASDPIVSFTNTSTGGNTPTYSWSFGDGNYSSLTNPVHTYLYSGTYLVCLTVYDDSLNNPNCFDTYCDTISISNAPPPPTPPCDSSFVAYPDTSNNGDVSFWATGQNNVSWSWNFGDNTTGTGPQTTHQYAQTGWYNVCLTVITSNSVTCTNCDSVYVLKTGTGIDEADGTVFGIKNYPNPFSNSTTISYSLKEKSDVNISVYNNIGVKMAELENSDREAGNHQLKWNAENLNAGVYFLEIKSGGSIVSGKMILIK